MSLEKVYWKRLHYQKHKKISVHCFLYGMLCSRKSAASQILSQRHTSLKHHETMSEPEPFTTTIKFKHVAEVSLVKLI